MLNGSEEFGEVFIFLLIISLFLSTNAAIMIAMMDKNIPIPILSITGIPFSFFVIFLAIGIKILSYSGMRRIIERVIVLCSVAGGILKFGPMFLFIAIPCFVKNVAGCWNITANIRSIVHMGNNRSNSLMVLRLEKPVLLLSSPAKLFVLVLVVVVVASVLLQLHRGFPCSLYTII